MTLRAMADWPEALETVERSINMTCCKGLPSGMTPHEALFTCGRIRRHESLIWAELVREDITHRALGMTPEEIDDACFQQEMSGNNAAFRAIDEFYNRLPTTEEAILDYEIGEESFPLLTKSDAPVGRSNMPVLENGQPRAESVPQNIGVLRKILKLMSWQFGRFPRGMIYSPLKSNIGSVWRNVSPLVLRTQPFQTYHICYYLWMRCQGLSQRNLSHTTSCIQSHRYHVHNRRCH